MKTNIRIITTIMMLMICIASSAQRSNQGSKQPSRAHGKNHTHKKRSSKSETNSFIIHPTLPTVKIKPFSFPRVPEVAKKPTPPITFPDGCKMKASSELIEALKERSKSFEQGDTLYGEALLAVYMKNEAIKGCAHAQFHYGIYLRHNYLTEQEQNEAEYWIKSAADNGCFFAKSLLNVKKSEKDVTEPSQSDGK